LLTETLSKQVLGANIQKDIHFLKNDPNGYALTLGRIMVGFGSRRKHN